MRDQRVRPSYYFQGYRCDVGIAVAKEFARNRLLRVPFIGVPREVVRDRNTGRREVRVVPAEGVRVRCRLTSSVSQSGIRPASGRGRARER